MVERFGPSARLVMGTAALALSSACVGGGGGRSEGAVLDAPPTRAIGAASVVSGFSGGRLRRSEEVDAYRITTHPVTNAEYGACVELGLCEAADASACSEAALRPLAGLELDHGDSPALCVGASNASAFCAAVGGRLPTLPEWLYAARGAEPQPYAWGGEAADCDRHALARAIAPPGEEDLGKPVRIERCAVLRDEGALVTQRHEKGASSQGLQDVLLSGSELVAGSDDPHFGACDAAFEGCVVTDGQVGQLASVAPLRTAATSEAYGFRCVMEAE